MNRFTILYLGVFCHRLELKVGVEIGTSEGLSNQFNGKKEARASLEYFEARICFVFGYQENSLCLLSHEINEQKTY